MEESRTRVIVDKRESGTDVVRWLRGLADLEMRKLDVGDYAVSDRIIIERKSAEDFLQSIVDRRLIRQMRELSESCDRPVLIIEGNEIFSRRLIHPNAIRGAIASVVADYGISIIRSQDAEDTAKLIAALARREQVKDKREVSFRPKIRRPSVQEFQRFVVEGLPGISCVLAKRLLEHFKTVENIMRASEEELMKVRGIGKNKARALRLVLTSQYE